MHFCHSIAVLCSFVVAACAALSAPKVIQQFTAQVQPQIDAIQNIPPQNISPENLQSLATVISEAVQSADAQLKALKGQPIEVVLGTKISSNTDVTKLMNDFVTEAKQSTGAVKTSVKNLLSTAPSGVHAVARPDVTTITTDLGAVVADIDGFIADLTTLSSDSSQL